MKLLLGHIGNPPKRILEETPTRIRRAAVSARKINPPFKEFVEFSGGRRDGTRQPSSRDIVFTTKGVMGVLSRHPSSKSPSPTNQIAHIHVSNAHPESREGFNALYSWGM